MKLLQYSNGWGHLIMSLATMAAGMYLIVNGQQVTGLSLLTVVTTAWFVPGVAKQIATEVVNQTSQASQADTPGAAQASQQGGHS